MNLIKIKCAFCEKEFSRSKGRFNEAKKFRWKQYCSWKCLSRDKIKRKVLYCENCGKRFERTLCGISPHNYCSQSCAAKINNKRYPKRKMVELRACVKCGKQFKKSKGNLKYCSMKCRREVEQRHTPQQLIEIIKGAAQELKRVPAKRELKKIVDTCVKFFGSWNNAVIAAGFQPNRSHSQRMFKRTNTVAVDGHLCDSVSEALIDNWLTENSISHKKDASYPETNHKTDWLISSMGQKIFIEYFGLANDSPRYDCTVRKKKELCRRHNLTLIAIYPRDIYPKERLDNKLRDKLKDLINL